ncbi:MAG: hypothetical protein AB1744_13605, partial [Candidatus Zixiibacteriota bacterium]
GTPPLAVGFFSWAADVLRLSHKPVLLEINPIRVAAGLVSAVEGTALGATQGRPLRDEKDKIITSGTVSGHLPPTKADRQHHRPARSLTR